MTEPPGVVVMGVVNVTPDSFSDGGRYASTDAAIAHGLQLARDGADIVDVGGEATGPRAIAISSDAELARVMPVIERLVGEGIVVSIDTTKAVVARAAVAAGASYVNDISGGVFDPDIGAAVGDAIYICGHLRGRSLREVFHDESRHVTWLEVADELAERLAALPADVAARAWVDPGLGFGKGGDPATNHALISHAGDLARRLGRPVIVGPSRKRFLRADLGPDPSELELDRASVRACEAAIRAGAHAVRIHNVSALRAVVPSDRR
ncbi:MAG TPA: dihydropteroate synthase [Kofleriaceae bacterium]